MGGNYKYVVRSTFFIWMMTSRDSHLSNIMVPGTAPQANLQYVYTYSAGILEQSRGLVTE